MTTEQISEFCDNLKQSLTDAAKRGTPVHYSRKEDNEQVLGDGAVIDALWMDCTLTVRIGRPAERAIQKDELMKARLMEALGST